MPSHWRVFVNCCIFSGILDLFSGRYVSKRIKLGHVPVRLTPISINSFMPKIVPSEMIR